MTFDKLREALEEWGGSKPSLTDKKIERGEIWVSATLLLIPVDQVLSATVGKRTFDGFRIAADAQYTDDGRVTLRLVKRAPSENDFREQSGTELS